MKRQLKIWGSLVVTTLLVTNLALSGCGTTTTGSNSTQKPEVNNVPFAATPSSSGAPQEEIKVHGHWTIEVRNPNGSLVENREFDNALIPNLDQPLCYILGRKNSIGGWKVLLSGSPSPFNTNQFGMLVEPADSDKGPGPLYSNTLTVDVPGGGDTNRGKLVLKGSIIANSDGQISTVMTAFTKMPATAPPSLPLYGPGWITLTQYTLVNPVNLVSGQQVQVTVVISFS